LFLGKKSRPEIQTGIRAEAEKGRRFLTIVSGLPRSGTSMMMGMVEAGGMPIVTEIYRGTGKLRNSYNVAYQVNVETVSTE
jgi:hypothetical protein